MESAQCIHSAGHRVREIKKYYRPVPYRFFRDVHAKHVRTASNMLSPRRRYGVAAVVTPPRSYETITRENCVSPRALETEFFLARGAIKGKPFAGKNSRRFIIFDARARTRVRRRSAAQIGKPLEESRGTRRTRRRRRRRTRAVGVTRR